MSRNSQRLLLRGLLSDGYSPSQHVKAYMRAQLRRLARALIFFCGFGGGVKGACHGCFDSEPSWQDLTACTDALLLNVILICRAEEAPEGKPGGRWSFGRSPNLEVCSVRCLVRGLHLEQSLALGASSAREGNQHASSLLPYMSYGQNFS